MALREAAVRRSAGGTRTMHRPRECSDGREAAMANDGEGQIVVGVDGSPSSLSALEWAADQAERSGAQLEIVTAWQFPKSYGYPLPLRDDFDPAAVAKEVSGAAADAVRKSHPALSVKVVVVEGHAGQALTGLAAGADMLVVGSRGHSEIVGILIGSISEYCVSHAKSPVVVLH
jgi:nucleotide-binding universal stress UspA family protein